MTHVIILQKKNMKMVLQYLRVYHSGSTVIIISQGFVIQQYTAE